ncbi:MAG: hypothetical protein OXH47_05525 [Paracoccaceae bacterium]|nr:hypothetical protein [Paracoccaceae bacterium]
MFGFNKRRRELEVAADKLKGKLLQDAVLEDMERLSHPANTENLSPEDYASTVAAWCALAAPTWQDAKHGIPDALRRTARNYLFGTGMPVKPLKAKLWLEVAKIIENSSFEIKPSHHPFWSKMETQLNEILTPSERIRAVKDAGDWVKVHWQLQRKQS